MEEFKQMSLDDLLNIESSNTSSVGDPVYENADVEVSIKRELNDNMSLLEVAELNRKEAMDQLAKYEECENKLTTLDGEMSLLQTELDALISKIKVDNKELIDKINNVANEIEATKAIQEKVKEDLLPLQRKAYQFNPADKTFKYNKIQSTYVAESEKNKFDLKKFREEQGDFWKEHLDTLLPYAEITSVADYLKITVSKK